MDAVGKLNVTLLGDQPVLELEWPSVLVLADWDFVLVRGHPVNGGRLDLETDDAELPRGRPFCVVHLQTKVVVDEIVLAVFFVPNGEADVGAPRIPLVGPIRDRLVEDHRKVVDFQVYLIPVVNHPLKIRHIQLSQLFLAELDAGHIDLHEHLQLGQRRTLYGVIWLCDPDKIVPRFSYVFSCSSS